MAAPKKPKVVKKKAEPKPKRVAKTKPKVDPLILEDILEGPPEANPSDVADYNDGSGVGMGRTGPPSTTDMDNLAASINTMQRRQEASEELHRRTLKALSEQEMRLRLVEDRSGINRGMKI